MADLPRSQVKSLHRDLLGRPIRKLDRYSCHLAVHTYPEHTGAHGKEPRQGQWHCLSVDVSIKAEALKFLLNKH